MSQALLAIQNILQNSNIFIGSRETVLITPFGKKKVTQFSGFPPTSVSYLKLKTIKAIFRKNAPLLKTLMRDFQEKSIVREEINAKEFQNLNLTLSDMGRVMKPPPPPTPPKKIFFFDHCAQTFRRRNLKQCYF